MPDYLPASAKLLVSDAEIGAAIARLAGELNARFADESEAVVVLTVMKKALLNYVYLVHSQSAQWRQLVRHLIKLLVKTSNQWCVANVT